MKKLKCLFFVILILFMASACNETTVPVIPLDAATQVVSPVSVIHTPKITPIATPLPTSTVELLPSKSGLKGYLHSISNQPVSSVLVRLAAVFWDDAKKEGAFVLDESASPSAITNGNGEFLFVNIEPGDYVILIGETPSDEGVVTNDDGSAKIYTAVSDKIVDIGTLNTILIP